jgi:hypothetical protein
MLAPSGPNDNYTHNAACYFPRVIIRLRAGTAGWTVGPDAIM